MLFLRARHLGGILAGIAVTASIAWLFGTRSLELKYGSGAVVPYATLLPALAAGLTGYGSRSGLQAVEWLSARPIRRYRLAVAGVLLAWTVASFVLTFPVLPGGPGLLAVSRNVLGLGGMGLLCASALGGRLAWLAPTVAVLGALSLASGVPGDHPLVLWPLAMDDDPASWLVALAWLTAGLAANTLIGTREPAGDLE